MAIEITTANFEKEVLQSKIPVIVDFWADWCGPCRMMAPVFEELSKEYAGKLTFAKVDITTQESLASKYDVQGIPNLIVFHKGKPAGQIVGFAPKQALNQKIQAALAGLK